MQKPSNFCIYIGSLNIQFSVILHDYLETMQKQKEPHTSSSSQKMAMAAFLVVLVVTCIIYGANLFNQEAEEVVTETIQQEQAPATAPPEIILSPKTDTGEEEVFMIVEQMPEIIGGLSSIQKHIKYPAIAKKAGIEGRVFIQFVVDKNGDVVNPVVVRGIGGGCDEEAVRAVSQAKFKPGKQRGQTVSVKMSVPVTFKLG